MCLWTGTQAAEAKVFVSDVLVRLISDRRGTSLAESPNPVGFLASVLSEERGVPRKGAYGEERPELVRSCQIGLAAGPRE